VPKIWQQTPDGRPIADDYRPDHQPSHSPASETGDSDIPELEPFLQGCLILFPEVSDEVGPRTGFFLFVLGAVDHFWQRFQLDDSRYGAYAQRLLRRFGLDWEQAASLVEALPRLPRQGPAWDALCNGAQTLALWLDSRDTNVMLRVKELIPEWRRIAIE